MQFELFKVDCTAKLAREKLPFAGGRVEIAFVEADSLGRIGLGAIHGQIRVADQTLRRLAVAGEDRHADAGSCLRHEIIDLKRLEQRHFQPVHEIKQVVLPVKDLQCREFVATDAGDELARP